MARLLSVDDRRIAELNNSEMRMLLRLAEQSELSALGIASIRLLCDRDANTSNQ